MAFPTTSAQQAETNRKILEEIQTKKQLLAGGIINLGLGTTSQVSVERMGNQDLHETYGGISYRCPLLNYWVSRRQ